MNAEQSLRLTCPKCAASVRAAAKLAGKRVKCPKCGGAIKVPGITPANGDDEDWLGLDEPVPNPPAASSQKSQAGNKTSSTGKSPTVKSPVGKTPVNQKASSQKASKPTTGDHKLPSVNSAEPADAGWMDDLPGLAPLASSNDSDLFSQDFPSLSDADMAALNSVGGFGANRQGPGSAAGGASKSAGGIGGRDRVDDDEPLPQAEAEVLTTADGVTEYRANCPICESVHHVKPKQAGKEISCGDCYSRFIVPPPPKPVVKKKMDIRRAATFELSKVDADRPSYAGPEARSAAEYLRQAEDEDIEEEKIDEYANPDMRAWLHSMFGIFKDPSVLVYWVALSFLGAVPGVIAVSIGHPFVLIGAGLAGLLYAALVVACGFAIMESAAGGEKTVSEWPIFSPADWFGQCFVAVAALLLSASPGLLLGYLLFGLSLALLATSMFSIFALFPFIFLSMLDNGSVFMPISGEVSKSTTRCKESWGVLYFSSMLLFIAHFIAIAMFSTLPPIIGVLFDCFLSVGLVFVYFSMLGGLAFQIGQAVNGLETDDT